MSAPQRFTLEPYRGPSTRHTCPGCGHRKEFTKYVDTTTGEVLPDHVGKCNRADRCGYHYPPRDYFRDNGLKPDNGTAYTPKPEPPPPVPFLHDRDVVKALRAHPEQNTLSAYWRNLIGSDRWDKVALDYALGTWSDGRMAGAAVYWQVDVDGKVKGGKVMLYDPATGHRSKEGGTTWVHSLTGGIPEGRKLEQCLFGEHLLKDWPMDKPVAVVESEKTAMIAAALMPDICWLATGSKDEFKLAKLQALTGRKVLAFPDLAPKRAAYIHWKQRALELHHLFASVHVSDILETRATTERTQAGMDIADLLLSEQPPAEVVATAAAPPDPIEAAPQPAPAPPPRTPPPTDELGAWLRQGTAQERAALVRSLFTTARPRIGQHEFNDLLAKAAGTTPRAVVGSLLDALRAGTVKVHPSSLLHLP
ncbi:MAG TPA: DUF6371 domain-containing protein [Flavobacteriales bacterium]|nr:DUF6371 domain-containing protein [Flavobacteriales bacterium]HRP82255.1 DUF6371 domain-containing protein [Flavobacteriales bacterium]